MGLMKVQPELDQTIANLGWMAVGAVIIAVFVEATILCSRETARRIPVSCFLLVLFTACQSFILSYLGTTYSFESCISTVAISSSVLVGLTGYAYYTSQDFSIMRTLVYLLGIAGFTAGALSSYFSYEQWWYPIAQALCVVAFGTYIVYDTSLIAAGKSHSLGYDDYIIAALLIYVDILMLFLEFLKLFGGKTDSK